MKTMSTSTSESRNCEHSKSFTFQSSPKWWSYSLPKRYSNSCQIPCSLAKAKNTLGTVLYPIQGQGEGIFCLISKPSRQKSSVLKPFTHIRNDSPKTNFHSQMIAGCCKPVEIMVKIKALYLYLDLYLYLVLGLSIITGVHFWRKKKQTDIWRWINSKQTFL